MSNRSHKSSDRKRIFYLSENINGMSMNKLSKLTLSAFLLSVSATSIAESRLVVWEDNGKGYGIEKAARNFAKENGCEVVIEQKDSVKQVDMVSELSQKGESTPDIFIAISDQISGAVNKGLITKLDRISSDTEKSKYLPLAVEAFSDKGSLYAAPRSIESLVVYYNKALLEYPFEVMDDYLKFNDKMLSEGKFGLVGKLDQFYISYGIFSGYGSYVFGSKNGKYNTEDVGLNNDGAVKALEFIRSYSKYLPKAVLTDEGWAAVDSYFKEGKAAAVINGPWALGDYAKSGVDYGVAPLPILPNGQSMRPFYGAKGYVVSADSKNKELAEKFLEYINRPEYALIRYSEIAELPPIKAVLENPLITNDDFANAIAIQIKNADAMPTVPELSNVWGPMGKAMSKVISREDEPKNALNKAVYEIKTNE